MSHHLRILRVSLSEHKRVTFGGCRSFRHTWVTNARKAGVDRTVIMKPTGHKTISMFIRYNTVDQADAKDAIEKLNSHYAKEETPSAAIVLQAQKRVGRNLPTP